MSQRDRKGKSRRYPDSRTTIIIVGTIVTAAVAISTQLAFPPSENWRTALYFLLGIVVTLVVADTADVVQRKIQGIQWEIRDFLMERVNSRDERTAAVIELCKTAAHEFRAVTFFPAVGVQDDPEHAPDEYLRALEVALSDGVEVTLVSVSCEEAKKYCELANFPRANASHEALDWIGERLEGLARRFPEKLELVHLPGDAITVNVCHNESTALIYHMSLEDDDGSGFRSTDARIVDVAKGAFVRYIAYCKLAQAPLSA